jgi:uncharacterized coiled-coil protein SlyX
MSHGLGRDGWPSATTVIKTLDEVMLQQADEIASLKAQLVECKKDVERYRDALLHIANSPKLSGSGWAEFASMSAQKEKA